MQDEHCYKQVITQDLLQTERYGTANWREESCPAFNYIFIAYIYAKQKTIIDDF